MRIQMIEWTEHTIQQKLQHYLSQLKQLEGNCKELIISFPADLSACVIDYRIVLNAMIGRLGRDMIRDEELGINENCISSIKTLVFENFRLAHLSSLISRLSKNYYLFIYRIEFKLILGSTKDLVDISPIDITRIERSPIRELYFDLVTKDQAEIATLKKLAISLMAIPKMKVELRINGEVATVDHRIEIPRILPNKMQNIKTKKKPVDKQKTIKDAKENWLFSLYSLVFVCENSGGNIFLPGNFRSFLVSIKKIFHIYGSSKHANLNDKSADLNNKSAALEALYQILMENEKRLLNRLKMFLNSDNHGKNISEEDSFIARSFYQQFILCGKENSINPEHMIKAWHSILFDSRHLFLVCKKFSEFNTKARFYYQMLKSPEAQSLLTQDNSFHSTLMQVLNLYYHSALSVSDMDKKVQLLDEACKSFGFTYCNLIVSKCAQDKTPKAAYLPQLLSMSLSLKPDEEEFQSFMQLLERTELNENTWSPLKDQLDTFIDKSQHKRYPERPIDEIFDDFLTSPEVSEKLSHQELKKLKISYLEIESYSKKFALLTDSKLKKILKKNIVVSDTKLIAALREIFKRKTGLFPKNIQIVNLLALLNAPNSRRLAQIKTGEGKSLIITLLAAVLALKKRSIYIITTADNLALRDAKKFEPLYTFIGVSVAHNIYDAPSSNNYKKQVIYGAIGHFRRDFLLMKLGRLNLPLTLDVVIPDEVDSMCIDTLNSPTIICGEAKYPAKLHSMIWSFVQSMNCGSFTKGTLSRFLKLNGVLDLEEKELDFLIKGVQHALSLREGVDYCIKKGKIVIIDHRHTGQLKNNSRWENGCHSFLEVKHGLKIGLDTYHTGQIDNCQFFNLFKGILGVSGTLGDKHTRRILKILYRVDLYDSPRNLPSRKRELPHHVVETEAEQHALIFEATKNSTEKGRPVLIFMPSVNESIKLSETFIKKSNNTISTQLYNGVQSESDENILALAGNPGMVTIATNKAGRGADVVPTPEAEANGGLDNINASVPQNLRVEEQNFGRTGRQGRQGTFCFILRIEQLKGLFEGDKPATSEEIIKAWKKERNKRSKAMSRLTQKEKNYTDLIFILQTVYWKLLEESKFSENLKLIWPRHFDSLRKMVSEVLDKNLFNKDDFDLTIRKLLKHFLSFLDANKVLGLTQIGSGCSIMHFLAKYDMATTMRLFAFYDSNLLIRQNGRASLPWQLIQDSKLRAEFEKFTIGVMQKPPVRLSSSQGIFAPKKTPLPLSDPEDAVNASVNPFSK